MVLERFGQVDPQGKNKTKTRKWRRYESLPRAVAPLAEGITPAGQKISYTDIEATLEQYGDFVMITDVIEDTHEDPVLQEMTKRCAEQMAETVEFIRFNVLKGGSNVFYAGAVASRDAVVGTISRGDIRKVVRMFHKYKGRPITRIVSASSKISTSPVAPAFVALAHTDVEADIRACTGFVPVEQYSDSTAAFDGEVGKVENVRFICTALFEPWLAGGGAVTTFLSGGAAVSGNADVYPVLFLAENAYGIVPLQGANAVTPSVVNPKPTNGDWLGQRGAVSWKTYQATAILNQLWMARLEVAVTSNPA
jgi:N4-gp56 family major capsid protein